MNVITNPPEQAGAFFLGRLMGSEGLAWVMIFVIEVAATAVEFGLLRRILGNMYREGALAESVTARRTILMVAVANAASFAFGFIGLIFLLIAMAP